MHRFETVQHLSRDGRPPFHNPNINNCSHISSTSAYGGGRPSFRGGNMFPHPTGGSRPHPLVGNNPRLAGLLASSAAGGGNGNGGHYGSSPFFNRMSAPHTQIQGQYNNGGGALMEGMGGKLLRNGAMTSSYGGGGGSAFGGMGYGTVGGGSGGIGIGNRFHPYQPPQQPPYQQQHQQRSGFLEQLLKNRGAHQSGYHSYGRPSASCVTGAHTSSSMGNQFHSESGHQQGYGYRVGANNFPYGGGGMTGNSRAPNYYPPPHLPQPYNCRGSGGVLGGGYPSFHHVPHQNGGGFHLQNPFRQIPQHLRNTHFIPIIKSEPEESEAESEDQDGEIQKSETRFRRNHERMNAILNETMADCNPVNVPMTRVDSLRRHVRILTDEMNKHKENAMEEQEKCAKRLQDFKESTTKYYSDYSKFCQPMADEEYDELVDKYYQEFKEKLKQQKLAGTVTSSGGGGDDRSVVKEGDTASDNEVVFIKEEKRSSSGGKPASNVGVGGINHGRAEIEDMVGEDDDYFDHPLFIDIPTEGSGQTGGSEPPQQQQQQNQIYHQNPGHVGGFPTPPMMQGGVSTFGGVSNEMQYGSHLQQQGQQQMEYSYYPPGQSSMTTPGNLLMPASTAQQPSSSLMQQQQFSRGYLTATSTGVAYQNQQFHGAYGHQQQQQQTSTGSQQPPQVGATNKARPRPSEELRDFLLGLVRDRYREDTASSPHQDPQLQHGGSHYPSASTSLAAPSGEGHSQQRRFMSGGGIVQVKPSSPPPHLQNQPSIYDDAATREWINALASSATAEASGVPADDGVEEEEGEDDNNNMQVDLDSAVVDSSSSSNIAGKGSKLAEILESPCLNDDTNEEFESELRQLADALNGGGVETTTAHEDDAEHGNEEDDDEVEDGELV